MIDPKSEPIKPTTDILPPEQLPSDLRVAVSGVGAGKPSQSDIGIPPVASSKVGQRRGPTLGIAISAIIFIVLLLAGTTYLLLGKVSFGVNRGTVKLTLDPAGTDLVIDGKFKRQSISSLSIKLVAGEHALLATKEGYLDREQEFTLSAGEIKEINLTLDTIPNIEVLVEGSLAFPELIRNGIAVAYLTPGGSFSLMDLITKERVSLFGDAVTPQINSINWAPGEPMALAKLSGTPTLPNIYDNRGVRGRFVPLGERPVQGVPRNTGTSSWLFGDARQTSKGWQPVLLNESVGNFDFSPDGSRIIYFYATADGEQSVIVAQPDGGDWERIATRVALDNPKLFWPNSDKYVLVIDANGEAGKDQLLDLVSKNFISIMPDRIADTAVASSPDGTRILYVSNEGGRKLAVWNLISNSREKLFDGAIGEQIQFVWQTDNKFILNQDDGSLWYWDLEGKERPVQSISAVGVLQPIKLLYSIINHQLLVVEQTRILSLKA